MENLGFLVLRFIFGMVFVMHGCQQVLPSFGGGKGLKGTEDTVARIGFRPTWLWARFLGFGTLIGGLLLTFGLFTALGAAVLVTIMIVAIVTTKLNRGFWNRDRGYEYNLSLIGGSAAVGLLGPGANSLDALLAPWMINPALFIAALLVSLCVASLGFVTRQPAQQAAER
jgi:putative oxidoreductase